MSDNSNTSIPENKDDMNALEYKNFPNISLPNQAVSYTHLTLPTIYSV